MQTVDNIDIIRDRILKFDRKGVFYVVHILKRKKDKNADFAVGDDDARLIKTYYIDSMERFDRKISQIKNLCFLNNARAYILPQRRYRLDTNRAMLKCVVDNIDNEGIHYDHILRSSVCGCHKSDRKLWVIDCDKDGDSAKWKKMLDDMEVGETVDDVFERYVNANVEDIKRLIDKGDGKYSSDDVFVIPTRNGKHIITPPFVSDPNIIRGTSIDYCNIKRDEMTLMYMPSKSVEVEADDSKKKLELFVEYLSMHHPEVYDDMMKNLLLG